MADFEAGKEIMDGIETVDFSYLCQNKDTVYVFVTMKEKNQGIIKEQLEKNGISNYVLMNRLFLQEICESVLDSKNRDVIDRYRNVVDDGEFLKKQFPYRVGYELNLDNPRTFNEKIQWLKLYDRNPSYVGLVDKKEFKTYIREVLGSEYVVPTLGVWDCVEEIEWDKLPERFVLKCTHDSGSAIICKDKATFDIEAACKKLSNDLKKNFYWLGREWPYKDVMPRIIAEELLGDNDEEVTDYKFFAFDGEVKAMFIATDRSNELEETKFDFFDKDFKHLDLINGHPNAYKLPQKPATFDEMVALTERLSKGFPHLRIDYYDVNGRIYIGEFTFSHWSGLVPFEPYKWDEIWGGWIALPQTDR